LFYPTASASIQEMVPPSKAQSLYVDARVCRPELASCAAENTSAFTFLKCSGLDATKVTKIDTYNLPLTIVARVRNSPMSAVHTPSLSAFTCTCGRVCDMFSQACKWIGCHAFDAMADNSSGSLYMFANSTTNSSTFYRLPIVKNHNGWRRVGTTRDVLL
jgi:hypothetical protein